MMINYIQDISMKINNMDLDIRNLKEMNIKQVNFQKMSNMEQDIKYGMKILMSTLENGKWEFNMENVMRSSMIQMRI